MFILTFDIGTTAVKSCLFNLLGEKNAAKGSRSLQLVDTAFGDYGLQILPNGGAEQDPDEWWAAIVDTSRSIAAHNPEAVSELAGISFCSQMQSVVLLDKEGHHLRPSMSYMDQRAGDLKEKYGGPGPKIADVGIPFLLKSLMQTGVVSASDKDPVWKYLWVKEHEPEVFQKIHKWLDVKEAIIARMTGNFVRSHDSAFTMLLLDKKDNKPAYSLPLIHSLGIEEAHLPKIVKSTDNVGGLLPEIASEMGLRAGTPVFAGGGDSSLSSIGAGCVAPGETHIYMGTSGWASAVTDRRITDTQAMVASVVGVQPGLYNYFAELETAGKCLEWVRDHLALDEINIYLSKTSVSDAPGCEYSSLYDYLSEVINKCPSGSGGVIFTPWLHGNRCPFEDSNARGMFFNIGLETGKTELIRAVVEGVCYHMRWFIELIKKKMEIKAPIRFIGGGALSSVTAGILADILQLPVETVADPQNFGAVGAALLVAAGLGELEDLSEARNIVKVSSSYAPNPDVKAIHDRNYEVFKTMYKANKEAYQILNVTSED
ncbi:MAG: carbohydrate kinase [Clostridiaceae bacterium]|nr:carbohydrate kinase [Clostridiaceae bacterium]